MAVIKVPLTRGMEALIDEEDLPLVSGFRWCAVKHGRYGRWYAQAHVPGSGARGKKIKMHQVIMGAEPGMQIDHRNRDGLDNRRENLRFCTDSQNQHNTGPRKGQSRFKGVSWHRGKGRWQAALMASGKSHFGGYFDSEEEAARRYNELALKHHGQFAHLNQVSSQEPVTAAG